MKRSLSFLAALMLAAPAPARAAALSVSPSAGGTVGLPALGPGPGTTPLAPPDLALGTPLSSPGLALTPAPALEAAGLPSAPRLSGAAALPASALDLAPAPWAPAALPAAAPERASPTEAPAIPEPATALGGLTQGAADLQDASASDPGGAGTAGALERLFSHSAAPSAAAGDADLPETIVNDEGVEIYGDSARYYKEIRRMVEVLKGRVNLSETLDVMEDSYASVWAKLAALEKLSGGKRAFTHSHNAHLGGTLFWADALLDEEGKRTLVHTHRVFFHRARNPRSEIEEGLRRLDGYIKEAVSLLKEGGRAEKILGEVDQIHLVFDPQGYAEIKDFIRAKEAELAEDFPGRFKFSVIDDLARVPRSPSALHRRLNALTRRHRGDGLDKIADGVIYSRYVGLLLELKTLDFLLAIGHQVLQSGREVFDARGHYVTELDVVGRDQDGKVAIWEAKSLRVGQSPNKILRSKVLAKLDTYVRHRKEIEASIGAPFDEVIFSVDVGRNEGLKEFLQGQEAELSRRYGFPVRFAFLKSEV